MKEREILKVGDVYRHKDGGMYRITKVEDGREDGNTLVWYSVLNKYRPSYIDEWVRVLPHFLESFVFVCAAETLVRVKLKRFEEICAEAEPYPSFVDNDHFEILYQSKRHKEARSFFGLYDPKYFIPHWDHWVLVREKDPTMFYDAYCFYADDFNMLSLHDWIVKEIKCK